MRQGVLGLDVAATRGLAAALMGLSKACIKLIDRNGVIADVSAAGRVVLELGDGEDIVGRYWPDLWPAAEQDRVRDAMDCALAGDEDRFTARCPTMRGNLRLWDVAVQPLCDATGWVVGAVAVSYDVTATAAHEGAAGMRAHPAPDALPTDVAPAGLEAVHRHAAGLVHDIRNVLSVSATTANLIEASSEDPVVRELAQGLGVAARDGEALVASLLRVGRQEPAGVGVVDARQALRESAPILQAVVGSGIVLQTELGHAAAHVLGSRHALCAAVMNLLSNARDACHGRGSVGLSLRCRPATAPVDASLRGPWIAIEVSDQGEGIDPARLQRLRAGHLETSKLDGMGTGLGLAAVRQFVRDAQGRLSIDSSPGNGTRVTLSLPEALPMSPGTQVVDARHGNARIVVAGDGSHRAGFFANLCRCLGYEVVETDDDVAASRASHAQPAPEMVLAIGLSEALLARLSRDGVRVLALGDGDRSECGSTTTLAAGLPPERVARAMLEALGRTQTCLELPERSEPA